MKRQTGLLLGSALLLMAHSSWATVCHNSNGTPTDVFYDLSNVFNSSNNQPGQVVTLPGKIGLDWRECHLSGRNVGELHLPKLCH
ncbi:fimbrial-like adhesin [Citrobacter freundii]|nr:fimbrial-like adhesin [Citrobacter freundii]